MFNSLCTFFYLRLLCSLCGHWILTSKVFLVRRTGLKDVPLSRHDDIQDTGPSRPHSSRLFVQKYGKQPPRFHAAEAGVAGLEGMESVGPAMAAAAFLLGAR